MSPWVASVLLHGARHQSLGAGKSRAKGAKGDSLVSCWHLVRSARLAGKASGGTCRSSMNFSLQQLAVMSAYSITSSRCLALRTLLALRAPCSGSGTESRLARPRVFSNVILEACRQSVFASYALLDHSRFLPSRSLSSPSHRHLTLFCFFRAAGRAACARLCVFR